MLNNSEEPLIQSLNKNWGGFSLSSLKDSLPLPIDAHRK